MFTSIKKDKNNIFHITYEDIHPCLINSIRRVFNDGIPIYKLNIEKCTEAINNLPKKEQFNTEMAKIELNHENIKEIRDKIDDIEFKIDITTQDRKEVTANDIIFGYKSNGKAIDNIKFIDNASDIYICTIVKGDILNISGNLIKVKDSLVYSNVTYNYTIKQQQPHNSNVELEKNDIYSGSIAFQIKNIYNSKNTIMLTLNILKNYFDEFRLPSVIIEKESELQSNQYEDINFYKYVITNYNHTVLNTLVDFILKTTPNIIIGYEQVHYKSNEYILKAYMIEETNTDKEDIEKCIYESCKLISTKLEKNINFINKNL